MNNNPTCTAKKNRGRPKLFDREQALDKALELFWAHGYEATSLADLVQATGAKAPTLYAEFENKQGLFRAALERYSEKFAARHQATLACPQHSVAAGVESYLRSTAACFTDSKTPAGCFYICTSSALSAEAIDVAGMLRDHHHAQESLLLAFLQQRQQQGELSANCDVEAVARYLCCVLGGMSVRAREGASRHELDGIIDTLMRLWPVLAGEAPAAAS